MFVIQKHYSIIATLLLIVISVSAFNHNSITRPKCISDSKILENDNNTRHTVSQADQVFIGRVKSPLRKFNSDREGSLEFPVEVKRVLKGSLKSKETVLLKLILDNCEPTLRTRQTLMFAAAYQGHPGRLVLITYPIPLSLRVLDKFNAAAKGEPYIPRPQIIETPCERKHCAHNADCIEVPTDVDPSGAKCECVTNCPDYDQSEDIRVCGSDNRVYPSRCHLRLTSCKNRVDLYIKHEGECDAHSPCVDHHCSQIGSHCILDAAGRPTCECVQYCSPKVFKDNWICGDDGVDYRNICELQKASCLSKSTIRVLYNGTCDPCASTTCPSGTICTFSEDTRQARCSCGLEICHRHPERYLRSNDEVCASDHKTYPNECEMKRQSCREQRTSNSLKVVYKGHCETGVHPCTIHSCPSMLHRCELEPQTGMPQCVCGPLHCPKVYTPLCVKTDFSIDGFDRVFTINSYCHLARLECQHGRRLQVLHEGKCDACEILDCSYYSRCIKDDEGRVSCLCPKMEHCLFDNTTTKEQYTVCGTNGETYFSECHLQAEACIKSQHIAVAHSGECDLCAGVICSSGARCSKGSCLDKAEASRITDLTPRTECQCHVLGTTLRHMSSLIENAQATTSCSCECRHGVSGLNCDRCREGYWGLHVPEFDGCTPCDCDVYGSLRHDCDQTNGRCVCKHGVIGAKCDLCLSTRTAPGPDYTCNDGAFSNVALLLPRDEPQQTKSVRHLMKMPSTHTSRPIFNSDVQNHQPKTVHVIPAPLLGDLCETDSHCGAPGSLCRNGACICDESTFIPSPDRTSCILNASKPLILTSEPGVWFNGRSSLAVLKPPATILDASRYTLSLHLEIKAAHLDGVLVYAQAKPTGHGDRIGLALVNGRVEFFYDLGGGQVRLVSPGQIRAGKSYLIQARRYRKDGWLRVQPLDADDKDQHEDNIEPVTSTSPGALTSLDLDKCEIYIGRVASNYSRVYKNIGTTQAFHGCISHLQINGVAVKWHQEHEAVQGHDNDEALEDITITNYENIVPCARAYCATQPCSHNALCVELQDTYKCVCPADYTGAHCEYEVESCFIHPCMHGAPCDKITDGASVKYKCKCPAGLHGDKCQQVESSIASDLWIPSFSGRESYLSLGLAPDNTSSFGVKDTHIELWLLINDEGTSRRQANTIMYWTSSVIPGQKRSSDYLVLVQDVDGALRMRYNLGSGPADIRTQSALAPGLWHKINIKLNGKRGSLSIDGAPPYVGVSPGAHAHLTLNIFKDKIFIGAPPSYIHLNPLSAATRTSFRGSVQRVILNDRPLRVLGPLVQCDQNNYLHNNTCAGRDVFKYTGKPCETLEGRNVCLNGGTCLPLLNDLICLCPDSHRGKYCEYNKNVGAASKDNDVFETSKEDDDSLFTSKKYDEAYNFNGMEKHAYRNRLTKLRSIAKGTRYQLEFKTISQNGLMFYRASSAKDLSISRDYIALAISKGKLQLAYVCGGDSTDEVRYLQSTKIVNDNKWHKVNIRQRKNSIQLKLNHEKDIKARCKRPQHGLKPNTKLWLGGAPKNSLLYSTLVTDEYLIGFRGCIRQFSVNNQQLDLSRSAPGGSSRSLQQCSES